MKRLKKRDRDDYIADHASSLVYVLYAVGIWKGDLFVADDEELEILEVPEIHARRLN